MLMSPSRRPLYYLVTNWTPDSVRMYARASHSRLFPGATSTTMTYSRIFFVHLADHHFFARWKDDDRRQCAAN